MKKIELNEEQLTDLKTTWIRKELDLVLGIQLAVGVAATVACSLLGSSAMSGIWLVTIVNIVIVLARALKSPGS